MKPAKGWQEWNSHLPPMCLSYSLFYDLLHVHMLHTQYSVSARFKNATVRTQTYISLIRYTLCWMLSWCVWNLSNYKLAVCDFGKQFSAVKTNIKVMVYWYNVQNALHCLEGMKQDSGRQSLIDRLHRDRGRQLHEINQPRQLDRRVSFTSLTSVACS